MTGSLFLFPGREILHLLISLIFRGKEETRDEQATGYKVFINLKRM